MNHSLASLGNAAFGLTLGTKQSVQEAFLDAGAASQALYVSVAILQELHGIKIHLSRIDTVLVTMRLEHKKRNRWARTGKGTHKKGAKQ